MAERTLTDRAIKDALFALAKANAETLEAHIALLNLAADRLVNLSTAEKQTLMRSALAQRKRVREIQDTIEKALRAAG